MPALSLRGGLVYWTHDKLTVPPGNLSMKFLLDISVKFKFLFFCNLTTAFCFLSPDIDWL